MRTLRTIGYSCLVALLCSGNASAAFIIIPFGAIQRALEIDPDSVSVSPADRAFGKCAGLHVNQAKKFSVGESPFPGDTTTPRPETPQGIFHREMAEKTVAKATESQKVADLASAYSTRWSRVAGADLGANRTYGADLARGCIQNDIPLTLSAYATWQAQQEQKKQQQVEDERKRGEESQRLLRAEEEAKRAIVVSGSTQTTDKATVQTASTSDKIDFTAEARKSARILGCGTQDVQEIGVAGQNILFLAACETGQSLVLICDPSGLCLKR